MPEVRAILRWPDPALTQKCFPVGHITREVEALAEDMLATMYDAYGRGLAAPQIGVMQRIFVMDATWKDGKHAPQVFVNPVICDTSADQVSQAEGCLSIPGVMVEVSRPAKVKLAWTGLNGSDFEQVFDGFAAACIQHEMDHLNGQVTFDRVSAAARAKALAQYEALP